MKKRDHVFTSETTILNNRTLLPYLTIFLPPQRGSKDRIQRCTGKFLLNAEVQIMSWLYSWVVSFCQLPYLTFVTKYEPLYSLKKIVIQYCVCVQSFEHLCGERKIVLQYGNIVRSLPKDNFRLCVWRTRARTSTCSNEIH